MQKNIDQQLIYSATDLVNFLLCPSIISYDIQNMNTPLKKAEDDEFAKIIQQKGFEHEESYFDYLKQRYQNVIDIDKTSNSNEGKFKNTLTSIKQGADIIFQAFLSVDNKIGHIDFLKKVDKPSALGDYSYEVIDTKLAKKTTPKFIMQLCFYSDLLKQYQGELPQYIHLQLGSGKQESYALKDYFSYYQTVKSRFENHLIGDTSHTPEPCDHCGYCTWRDICKEKWEKEDHLYQVANITSIQIRKLSQAGITTLEQLGEIHLDIKVPKILPVILERLKKQASLQLNKRVTGEDQFEFLPLTSDQKRGFHRLLEPDTGDLFFDMEGDPLEENGLEYLFGLYYFHKNKAVFKCFWAHDRKQEKQAFENFIDFVWQHLKNNPNAHIYHYAHYEETAIKRLMSFHGTREREVDELLRNSKLVDLYKVVRESLLVSEPSYSIKNLEHFYLEKRAGDVVNAAESVIFYEKWKLTQDKKLLDAIQDYNKEDCRSTFQLREWLHQLKKDNFKEETFSIKEEILSENTAITEFETLLAKVNNALTNDLPEKSADWNPDHKMCILTGHLLDFYRRSDKPLWWAIFSRMEMSEEELIDDPECLGGLRLDKSQPPYPEKRSTIYTYTFPEQEHKIREGGSCTNAKTGGSLSIFQLDNENNIVKIKKSGEAPPSELSIGPGRPIDNSILRIAIFRFAGSLIEKKSRYTAIEHLLKKENPTIKNRSLDQEVINPNNNLIDEIIAAVNDLDNSYLSIQGPPGSGKTYTASHVITALLKKGKRVGVSSNSHKAINNLLSETEKCAIEQSVHFTGSKKSSGPDTELKGLMIKDVKSNKEVKGNIVGATAWFFARDENEQTFDYLFVDEAGQLSLAHIIAMGLAAKNIILLGDQMQLGQPIQGVHPGDSGKSILDYLMEGYTTIPPDKGVFLPTTYRMHQDVCKFISDIAYDGRLVSEHDNSNQKLILLEEHDNRLQETGIRFIEVTHDTCSQSSVEEAEVIKELISDLLKQKYSDKQGAVNPITLENILIVAPYNMQVNLLKKILPEGTRIGTVDKFQGQEAEVVIVSMTTSSGEYLPRYIDFLFSKQRLNVAISRAKCLALLVANPKLLEINCNTVVQMGLVNTLCHAHHVGTS